MIKVTLTSDRVSHNIRISFKDPTPFIDLTVERGYRVRSLFSVLWPQNLKDYPCLDPFGSLVKSSHVNFLSLQHYERSELIFCNV